MLDVMLAVLTGTALTLLQTTRAHALEVEWSLVFAAIAGFAARGGKLLIEGEQLKKRAIAGHLILTSLLCYAVAAAGQLVWPSAPPTLLQILTIFFGVQGNDAAMRWLGDRFDLPVAPQKSTTAPTDAPRGSVGSGDEKGGS